MVLSLANPEEALRPVKEPSFYTAMKETHGDISQPPWKAVLKEEPELEGKAVQTRIELVTSMFKPRVDDRHGKDCTRKKATSAKKGKQKSNSW